MIYLKTSFIGQKLSTFFFNQRINSHRWQQFNAQYISVGILPLVLMHSMVHNKLTAHPHHLYTPDQIYKMELPFLY